MKVLSIDDMLEALSATDMSTLNVQRHITAIEMAATALAADLAEQLGIECGRATFEGKDMGGTCATFWPKTARQKCPEPIHNQDPGGDWERPCENHVARYGRQT